MTETSGCTIVVDDDPIVHRTIETILGVKAIAFLSGAAFVAGSTECEPPSAVFIDIHLGQDDSGLDLIPLIRERWPHCPIMVVTGDEGGESIGQAMAAGANDYLRKPLVPHELVARLRVRSIELSERAGREILPFGDLRLDLSLDKLSGPLGTSYLSHADMRLLTYLVQSKETLITREELKRKLWGSLKVSDNALDKKLYWVRGALRQVSSTVKLRATYRRGFSLVSTTKPTAA